MSRLSNLDIEIYSDGADLDSILKLNNNPLIKGFTTNPTLMKKSGIKDYKKFALELLSNIKDDRIPVEINPGRFKSDSIIYRLPKVVQGTYEISNFGSYVSNFNAYDYKGINLPAKSLDENSWIIYSVKKLDRI